LSSTLLEGIEVSQYTLLPKDKSKSPFSLYCEISIAKGKKLFDKRAVLAERDANREAERIFGRRNK
jgi:SsrA-binding protein